MPVWFWWTLGGVVLALWCALSAGVWPFANCRRCRGKGRWSNPNPADWRKGQDKWIWCSVCKGSGRRFAWTNHHRG